MSDTINYGIDLGTTNSAIAVAGDGAARIVQGPGNVDTIPSAVSITRNGAVRVGRRAAELVVDDPENAYAEFKLRMGQGDQDVVFRASGRTMSPEELSAQVLMTLRGHVENKIQPGRESDKVETAVITVPAAFTSDQSTATVRAAELAGLVAPKLLQEPTAAAWAYMSALENPPKQGFWLVYDFGGGTFDAAIVNLDDGEFSVVGHAGDNSLGGKRIDWVLVEDVLLPALDLPADAPDILNDRRVSGAKAKLKTLAELAKISLSGSLTADLDDDVPIDGDAVELAHTVTRADLDRAALPLVESTIRLCRQAIERAGLRTSDIERVVLVGGSSQLSLVRELLADPDEGLGIPLDDSQDPMTVVARGAALYAATQALPREVLEIRTVPDGTVELRMEYPRAGQDEDPLLGGRAVFTDRSDWTGWTLEVVNTTTSTRWSSGYLPLRADGTFSIRLRAPEPGRHVFDLNLRSPDGSIVPVAPATITYHHSDILGEDAARTTYDTGIGLHDNSLYVLIPRNAQVPRNGSARGLRTSQAISKSAGTGKIVIPIFQGDHARADRNDIVGRLIIGPDDVSRDVPANSTVEVSVRIDAGFSFTRAEVYIDHLGEIFEMTIDPTSPPAPTVDDLEVKHNDLIERLNECRSQANEVNATDAETQIAALEMDGTLAEVERQLAQAQMDPDAARTCDHAMRNVDSVLDRVEKEIKIPTLVHDLKKYVSIAGEIATAYGSAADRRRLAKLETDASAAIAGRDEIVLERRIQEVISFIVNLLPPGALPDNPGVPAVPTEPTKGPRDSHLKGAR